MSYTVDERYPAMRVVSSEYYDSGVVRNAYIVYNKLIRDRFKIRSQVTHLAPSPWRTGECSKGRETPLKTQRGMPERRSPRRRESS